MAKKARAVTADCKTIGQLWWQFPFSSLFVWKAIMPWFCLKSKFCLWGSATESCLLEFCTFGCVCYLSISLDTLFARSLSTSIWIPAPHNIHVPILPFDSVATAPSYPSSKNIPTPNSTLTVAMVAVALTPFLPTTQGKLLPVNLQKPSSKLKKFSYKFNNTKDNYISFLNHIFAAYGLTT